MTTTPQVNRSTTGSSGSSVGTVRTGDSGTRVNRGATNHSGGSSNSGTSTTTTIPNRRTDIASPTKVGDLTKSKVDNSTFGTTNSDSHRTVTPSTSTTKPNDKGGNGRGGNGRGGNDNKGGNGRGGNDNKGGNSNIDPGHNGGKPGNIDPGHDRNGKDRNRGGNRPNGNRPNGNRGHNGNHGYNHDNHFDYSNHHYRNDFHRYYTNHYWSWSRPLPPPVRHYRPAPIVWYRPVIPVGWHPYASAPIIDRILGITFGTLFDTSLDYLYINGYEIDGYADHVIYLRNVPLLNLAWEDVMLCYDDYDRLVNAQFIFHTSRTDRYRYNRVYNSLCRVYGQPINSGNNGLSWYGGGSTGWVTLSTFENLGHYYTTLSIGY